MEIKSETVFESILKPVSHIIEDCGKMLGDDAKKYTLSFTPFTLNLIYGFIMGIPSIALLVTHIKTKPELRKLNAVIASKSMYSEAFSRYSPDLYRSIFLKILKNIQFQNIPDLENLGKIFLVDGSDFPAIQSMYWAAYKEGINSVKMNLAFELNRMIPVCFSSGDGKSSERDFLTSIIHEGITYICDRGYVSFSIFQKIHESNAFFVIRGKSNLLYNIKEYITVNIPSGFLGLFSEIVDVKVSFANDKSKILYRIVSFKVDMETYILITNRFDLTTYQVIMLYAYRWQVELIFKFLKRTMTGVHLYSQDQKGVEVQFYIFMICYLLLLFFKQNCIAISDDLHGPKTLAEKRINTDATAPSDSAASEYSEPVGKNGRRYVRGLVSLLGEQLQKLWKIDIHWLEKIRNLLFDTFCPKKILKQ